jgi:hypothetical protein
MYIGNFEHDSINGSGTFTWPNGRIYEGSWKDGKMSGQGNLMYEDGNEYNGEFMDDCRHGYGVFTWKDGKRYEGPWEKNKQHGVADLVLPPANGESEPKWVKAEFKDGVKIRYIKKQNVMGQTAVIERFEE